jgi:hypothetical protein
MGLEVSTIKVGYVIAQRELHYVRSFETFHHLKLKYGWQKHDVALNICYTILARNIWLVQSQSYWLANISTLGRALEPTSSIKSKDCRLFIAYIINLLPFNLQKYGLLNACWFQHTTLVPKKFFFKKLFENYNWIFIQT